jgi:hypothetical protein
MQNIVGASLAATQCRSGLPQERIWSTRAAVPAIDAAPARSRTECRNRRALPLHDQGAPDTDAATRRAGIATHLQKQMADYAATG